MSSGCQRDEISKLPDEILHHVLSFLPTKNAVATSILSTRWRYLWTCLLVLDLDDGLPSHIRACDGVNLVRKVSFVNMVDTLLLSVFVLNKVSSIQKFRLSCGSYCRPFLYKWINTAIQRNIKELDLELYMEVEMMPYRLFTCQTLVVLKLTSGIDLDIPQSVSLPNLKILHLSLKILHLSLGKCKNNGTFQKLLSGCTVLEKMVINRNELDEQWDFSVSSPTLKSLSIEFSVDDSLIRNWPDNHEYKLVFNTPSLESLHLEDFVSEDLVVENMSSLISAHACFAHLYRTRPHDDYVASIFKFLKGISHLKFLSLSDDTLLNISQADDFALPIFHNLTHLEYQSLNDDYSWNLLANVLDRCPHLEVLVVKEGNTYTDDCQRWDRPQAVPMCLVSHLKEIDIQNFHEAEHDVCVENAIDYIMYLLENSNVLKKMTIGGRAINLEEESCVCKRLLKIVTRKETSKFITRKCRCFPPVGL